MEIPPQEVEVVPGRHPHSHRNFRALVGFALVAGLFFYAFRLVRVQGRSMEPTYHDGQLLLVRRFNWPGLPPRAGEVVVFRMGRELLVKRIAATAGQRVLPRPMLRLYPVPGQPGTWVGRIEPSPPRTVPQGFLYVLGDNRRVSQDSRSFGLVPVAALLGRVIRWKDPGRAPLRTP